jgi:NitT/TauT family transport system substrate-binding protein
MRLLSVDRLLAACAVAVLVSACAPAAPTAIAPLPTAAPVSLKVLTLPFISFAPLYIAYEEGYYVEQGLNVELVETTEQTTVMPALVSGQVDVSGGQLLTGVFNTIARSGNVAIVADKGYIDPASCSSLLLIARKGFIAPGESIKAEHLRGKTVNMPKESWQEYYMDTLLAGFGVTLSEMRHVEIPSPAIVEAAEKGQVDLIMQNEPWVTRLVQAGNQPVLAPPHEILPDSQQAILLYGPKLLSENQDAGNRFMAAYLKAVRQYNQGKTERNVDILAKYIRLDKATISSMCWPALRGSGDLNVASVVDWQSWAVGKGLMASSVPEAQFWKPSFVQAANQMFSVR